MSGRLRFFVAVMLAVVFTPRSILAQGTYFISYGISVAGVQVNSDNANAITGNGISGTVVYDAGNQTLILDNATINGCIYSYGDLTIDLRGTNTIAARDTSALKNTNTAAAYNLTFKSGDGTGSLTLSPCSYYLCEGFNEVKYEDGLSLLLGSLEGWQTAVIATHLLGGGNGSADSPYLISSAADLKNFSDYYNRRQLSTETFQLTADIDCADLDEFFPIGNKNPNSDNGFKGTFDGNGKTISNLWVRGTFDYIGLFGYVDGGAIENLTLDNIHVINEDASESAYAGAIAGYVDGGTVRNTLVTGKSEVISMSNAGAILGNYNNATLANNYYDYAVRAQTSESDLTGYSHRGIGDEDYFKRDVKENDGAIIYNRHYIRFCGISQQLYDEMETIWTNLRYCYDSDYIDETEIYTVVAGKEVIFDVVTSAPPYEIKMLSVVNTITNETIDLTPLESVEDYASYSFTMPDADVRIDLKVRPIDNSQKYDLWIGDQQVSENNCSDILGDGMVGQQVAGSFQYVPTLNKLFITNSTANLNIKTKNSEGLTVYLAPNSNNVVRSITYTGEGLAGPLTITTDGNNPGNLLLGTNPTQQGKVIDSTDDITVISGFSDLILDEAQNLAILDPEDAAYQNNQLTGTTYIGVPLKPMDKETTIVPDGNEIVPEAGQTDINKIVDDVLYTLGNVDDDRGDGFDDTENCIVINTITSDKDAVKATEECIPGSTAFFDLFKGITFMVPAGRGSISLTIQTENGYALKMKIGDAEPIVLERAEKTTIEEPYNVGKPTYVYLYASKTSIEARSINRGGKKTLAGTRTYGTSVRPSTVKASNPAGEASGGAYIGETFDEGQEIITDDEKVIRLGDVNGDGEHTAADIVEMAKAIMGRHSGVFDKTNADLNGDGQIDIADILMILAKIK